MAQLDPYAYLDYQPQPDELAQLPTPPPAGAPVSGFQQDLGAIPSPELQDVPAAYTQQEYQPSAYERFAEDYAAGQGGLQLTAPRTTGQGILLGLNAALAGRGSRVARARASFQKSEEARAKAVDEQRKLATQANLTLLSNYKGALTNAQVQNAIGAEKYKRETPEREAAAARQAANDLRAQQNADRQQRSLDRQNDLAQANTTQQISTQFNADPDVVGYRTASNNLRLANVAAKQGNGVGDNALIRLYVRSTDDPRVASVVRESEAAGVEASVGLLAKAKVLPAKWVHGDLLNEEGRQAILKSMRETTSGIKPQYDQAYAQYRDRVNQFGQASGLRIDPKLLLREYNTDYDFAKAAGGNSDFESANRGNR